MARARKQLHQWRHLLGLSAVPLSVAYDAQRKAHRLETPLELLWAVELVRGGVLERLGREFMPYCGSQWPAQLEGEVLGTQSGLDSGLEGEGGVAGVAGGLDG